MTNDSSILTRFRTDFTSSAWNFLSLRRRRSSWRNVSSGEEQGETAVFADYKMLISDRNILTVFLWS